MIYQWHIELNKNKRLQKIFISKSHYIYKIDKYSINIKRKLHVSKQIHRRFLAFLIKMKVLALDMNKRLRKMSIVEYKDIEIMNLPSNLLRKTLNNS